MKTIYWIQHLNLDPSYLFIFCKIIRFRNSLPHAIILLVVSPHPPTHPPKPPPPISKASVSCLFVLGEVHLVVGLGGSLHHPLAQLVGPVSQLVPSLIGNIL